MQKKKKENAAFKVRGLDRWMGRFCATATATRKPVHMTTPPTNGESTTTTTMWQPPIPVKVKRRRRRGGGGGGVVERLSLDLDRAEREGGREGGGSHRAYLCLAAARHCHHCHACAAEEEEGAKGRTYERTRQKGSESSGG